MESKVTEVRDTIYGAITRMRYMMDKNIVTPSARKYEAIETLRRRFDNMEGKSLSVHYRWILEMHKEMLEVMPGAYTRFQRMRSRMLNLMAEAEHTINRERYRVKIAI